MNSLWGSVKWSVCHEQAKVYDFIPLCHAIEEAKGSRLGGGPDAVQGKELRKATSDEIKQSVRWFVERIFVNKWKHPRAMHAVTEVDMAKQNMRERRQDRGGLRGEESTIGISRISRSATVTMVTAESEGQERKNEKLRLEGGQEGTGISGIETDYICPEWAVGMSALTEKLTAIIQQENCFSVNVRDIDGARILVRSMAKRSSLPKSETLHGLQLLRQVVLMNSISLFLITKSI